MGNKKLLDRDGVRELIGSLASDIINRNRKNIKNICIIGIRNRGDILAVRLAKYIYKETGIKPPVGAIDITLYRDDLTTIGPRPLIGPSEIPCSIDNRIVILVDDVLYTGRTVRAALDELVDFGRPLRIELAVLVDRGGRELPICPDYVGIKEDVDKSLNVAVYLEELDGEEGVIVKKEEYGKV